MKNIVIFGAGGHGKVIADILEKQMKYNVLGYLDSNKKAGTELYGYKVLGNEKFIENSDVKGCIVAIGDNWIRSIVVNNILKIRPDIKFINAIHPSAQIGRGVTFGKGNVVMANAAINSDAVIGEHCIINTMSSIEHDNLIGDYTTFAPGSIIGGNSRFGDYSTLSLGASVIHGINVGEHTVIGAGSTVLNDIDSYSVAYGTPARVIRKRKENDRYL